MYVYTYIYKIKVIEVLSDTVVIYIIINKIKKLLDYYLNTIQNLMSQYSKFNMYICVYLYTY